MVNTKNNQRRVTTRRGQDTSTTPQPSTPTRPPVPSTPSHLSTPALSSASAQLSTSAKPFIPTQHSEMDHTYSSSHSPDPSGTAPPTASPAILSTLQDDISSLSEEGKVIVNTIVKALQNLLDIKDQKIHYLESRIKTLEKITSDLESQIDDVNQYERRDTLIISGPSLPSETQNENSTEVVVNAIKQTLRINIDPTDINIAHRIGNKSKQSTMKPIIVKLHSRQKKEDIISACITIKPNLYVNESLTPKRLALFKTIRSIRKAHLHLFKQCYTKDGKIHIKLSCSNQKHIITNEQTLNDFLDKFPTLRSNV